MNGAIIVLFTNTVNMPFVKIKMIVKTQQMFPDCQKYKKCCSENTDCKFNFGIHTQKTIETGCHILRYCIVCDQILSMKPKP